MAYNGLAGVDSNLPDDFEVRLLDTLSTLSSLHAGIGFVELILCYCYGNSYPKVMERSIVEYDADC